MNTNLPLGQAKLNLPNIYSIGSSEKAYSDAFLIASQVLAQCLDQFQVTVRVSGDFTRDFNSTILGLFSKMCRHYYSYVLLEINQDERGSQFLIEHLCEAAITLAYLLEEGDQELFSNYLSASLAQAQHLLTEVEEELSEFPNNIELKDLKVKLQTIINKHLTQRFKNHSTDSKAYLWGTNEIKTTEQRGAILGLNFLNNPARKIALKIVPASWLECQISRSNFTKISTQANPAINFTELRDAAHLCLHITRILIEEVFNVQDINRPDIEDQQQLFDTLFQWFHNAHNAYQMHCV